MRTQAAIGSLGAFALAFSLASSAFALDILSHHLDIDVDYVSNNLMLDIKTYSPMSAGVPTNNDDYSPANRIRIPQSNTFVIPNPAGSWACVAPAGTTIYRILQNESDTSKTWVGWNSMDLVSSASGVTFAGNQVTLSWSVVSKPMGSEIVAYSKNSLTGVPNAFYFNTRAGCVLSSVNLNTSVGTHFHPEWAVNVVGEYQVNFRVTGTVGGVAKDSGNVLYKFIVK
jgi:hypothetical protein